MPPSTALNDRAHYIADRAAATDATVSRLAQGVPIGGELDYLDEGTLTAALKARRSAIVMRRRVKMSPDVSMIQARGDGSLPGALRAVAIARAEDR